MTCWGDIPTQFGRQRVDGLLRCDFILAETSTTNQPQRDEATTCGDSSHDAEGKTPSWWKTAEGKVPRPLERYCTFCLQNCKYYSIKTLTTLVWDLAIIIQSFSQKILLEGQSGPWRSFLEANFLGKGPLNWKLQKEKRHQGTKRNKAIY